MVWPSACHLFEFTLFSLWVFSLLGCALTAQTLYILSLSHFLFLNLWPTISSFDSLLLLSLSFLFLLLFCYNFFLFFLPIRSSKFPQNSTVSPATFSYSSFSPSFPFSPVKRHWPNAPLFKEFALIVPLIVSRVHLFFLSLLTYNLHITHVQILRVSPYTDTNFPSCSPAFTLILWMNWPKLEILQIPKFPNSKNLLSPKLHLAAFITFSY